MSDAEIVRAYFNIPQERRMALGKQMHQEARLDTMARLKRYADKMEEIIELPLSVRTRTRETVAPRAALAYYLYDVAKFSKSDIARAIGREFSTVHLYCEQMDFDLSHNVSNERTELLKRYIKHLEDETK